MKSKHRAGMLSGVGGVFGFLAGSSTGPGLLLVPFMLGYGLSRTSFVATLAVIAALTHVARAATFGSIGLIGQEVLILGLIGGAATIPGNMLGKVILKKMTNHNHEILVDLMAFGGGINFLLPGFGLTAVADQTCEIIGQIVTAPHNRFRSAASLLKVNFTAHHAVDHC